MRDWLKNSGFRTILREFEFFCKAIRHFDELRLYFGASAPDKMAERYIDIVHLKIEQ